MSVILETTIGDLVVDLFTAERPRACLNFIKLCKVKFYNYSLFHFVQRNFLAQTGDPTGSGRGGESIFRSLYGDQATFFEAETKPRIKHVKKGTVSMVNNGQDMHGSQFFVTLGENLDYLDGQHTVFGEVAEGFDVLNKLNETICDDNHCPYQDIRVTHTVILDDPFDDPDGLKVPDRSPEPTKEQLDSGRIGADEEIDDSKGKTVEEVEEMIEQREFNARTQILEMVGDIPDADMKPPENVLFVCKLNPVTTDEDLEIIFSRFGAIKCCEIIKDAVSQESLQYAFIEYENVEDCERAYFKMDNVLIDDRRIHVDFSQSVAKMVHNKPGSKPIYELKDKKENIPKLKIRDISRKEKYDLVFESSDSDSDGGTSSTPSKRLKEKKYFKKRQRTSSNERSPGNSKRKGLDMKSGGNRHGNQGREDSEEERQYTPSDRRGKQSYRDTRDTKDDKRDKRPEHGDRKDHRGDNDDRAEKHGRNRYYAEGEVRRKERPSGKRGDRDRSSEDRSRRNDRDITRDKGEWRDNSGDKYSRDYSRNERGYKGKEKTTEERSHKKRQDSEEAYSRDKREYHRKEGKAVNAKTTRDSGSEDEEPRRKRRKER